MLNDVSHTSESSGCTMLEARPPEEGFREHRSLSNTGTEAQERETWGSRQEIGAQKGFQA